MIERLEIGCTPYGESCAQVGSDNYGEQAKKECRAYVNQLYRILEAKGHLRKTLPENFSLQIKGNSHDFGMYYEVVCKFEDDNEEACDLAYFLEGNSPENWDEIAKNELGLLEDTSM